MADPVSIPPPNYTQIPNAILDLMADMSDAEFRVVMAIARQTFGWHKKRDKISLTQLQKLTGMSRQGVVGGIAAGVDRGVVERTPDTNDGRGGLWYRLLVNDVDQSSTWTSQQRDQSTSLTRTSQRRGLELVNDVDTQKKGKKTKETPPPPTPAAFDSPIGDGGGEDRSNGKPNKTELYYWLCGEGGVDSPAAAERNQHHDPAATKAFHRKMVGDSVGAERKKLVGRFIRKLDADGPPPIPISTNGRAAYPQPPPRDPEPTATAAQILALIPEEKRNARRR